jgi:hypothetical protein
MLHGVQTVRRLFWNYYGIAEDEQDKEFYTTLQSEVARKLRILLRSGEPLWVGREAQMIVGRYAIRARLTNIEPALATQVEPPTEFVVRYRERTRDEQQGISTFLAETLRYPHSKMGEAYDSLVGIDAIKQDMLNKLQLLLDPQRIERWLDNQPGISRTLAQLLSNRYPLIILEGEVGSGKTMLARV